MPDPSISTNDLADSMENWAGNETARSVISLQFNEQIMWCPQGTDGNAISPHNMDTKKYGSARIVKT